MKNGKLDYSKLIKNSLDENHLINTIAIELELQKTEGNVDENLKDIFDYLIKNGVNEFILCKILAL